MDTIGPNTLQGAFFSGTRQLWKEGSATRTRAAGIKASLTKARLSICGWVLPFPSTSPNRSWHLQQWMDTLLRICICSCSNNLQPSSSLLVDGTEDCITYYTFYHKEAFTTDHTRNP